MDFYSLYYDLAVQLNDTASDSLKNTKVWINWTLRDLCNMYEFPELYKTVTTTGTSYDFDRVKKLTANSTVSLFSDSALDTQVATIYGSTISSGARTYSTEDVTLTGVTTASGATSFSFVDRIEFASALNGNVSISAQSGVLKGTALVGESEIGNDHKRVIKVDSSGDLRPMTLADRKLKWTNDSSITDKVYTESGSGIDLFQTGGGTVTITYLKKHPYLINDYDESPVISFGGVEASDIIECARLGWGLRFEDEQDGVVGKQVYKSKLLEIINDIVPGGDDSRRVQQTRRR